ncbi:MAG: ABC transporter ATP-binding protein [Anaerolineales bacterium]|jgi:ABC-2 type transport system ATP-binding protein
MDNEIISIKEFTKSYDDFVAVNKIDFSVKEGEIFGLLGPNGAGKTTTLECLEGLRLPDSGELHILGVDPHRDPRKLRNIIGVQLQTSGLPDTMTVREAMNFFSAYHASPPNYEILTRMGLDEKRDTQYHQLSTGQKRRLSLALAIAHDPPVIILDEPTAGLDVASRSELHGIMQELRAGGTTIILATHDMAEAEKMTDRVAILLRGQIVDSGSPRELTSKGGGLTKISVRTDASLLHEHLGEFPAVTQQLIKEEYTIYYSTDPGATVSALLEFIKVQGDNLIDLRVERPTLEERFLEITTAGGIQ